MYELPQELQKDLRSWRGSIRLSRDLEEGGGEHHEATELSDKDVEKALAHESSMILHPTASTQYLNSPHQQPHNPTTQPTQPQALPQPRKALPAASQNAPTKDPADADPAAPHIPDTPLTPSQFYALIGMLPPPSSSSPPSPHHRSRSLEAPHGLYALICSRSRRVQQKYAAWDVAIMALLVLQLLLSAVFIILGSLPPSADSKHLAIPILGAISTVIAGVLALMKGQGLPNRLRMERDGIRRVALEAQFLYADVVAGKQVWWRDVEKVRRDYEQVCEDARRNHPDVWVSAAPVGGAASAAAGLGAGAKGGKAAVPLGGVVGARPIVKA